MSKWKYLFRGCFFIGVLLGTEAVFAESDVVKEELQKYRDMVEAAKPPEQSSTAKGKEQNPYKDTTKPSTPEDVPAWNAPPVADEKDTKAESKEKKKESKSKEKSDQDEYMWGY